MINLIHKRGIDSSAAIGKAKKKVRMASGSELCHPFDKFKGKKISR